MAFIRRKKKQQIKYQAQQRFFHEENGFNLSFFTVGLHVIVGPVAVLTPKTHKGAHSDTSWSHSAGAITETQTAARAHTHTLRDIPKRSLACRVLPACCHTPPPLQRLPEVSAGRGTPLSDQLFNFPPCLFFKDSVINSLTRPQTQQQHGSQRTSFPPPPACCP